VKEQYTSGFQKMRKMSLLTEVLLVTQEELGFSGLVRLFIC
jgi:hypothetical protein